MFPRRKGELSQLLLLLSYHWGYGFGISYGSGYPSLSQFHLALLLVVAQCTVLDLNHFELDNGRQMVILVSR